MLGRVLLRFLACLCPIHIAQLLNDGVSNRQLDGLIRFAVAEGKRTRPDIKLGICGEHGGDPASVKFCNTLGLTYVSCSPYRVPTARLAAAQAALEQE